MNDEQLTILRIEQVLKALPELWKTYDESARELLVHVISQLNENNALTEDQKQRLGTIILSPYARLIRDPRLAGIVPNAPPRNYEWAQLWPQRIIEPNRTEIVHWVALHQLRENCLDPTAIDPALFSRSQAFPEQWDQLIAQDISTVILSDSLADSTAVALALRRQQQERVFPIGLSLTRTNLTPKASPKACLRAVTRTFGEAWMHILQGKDTSGVFLDLPRHEQIPLSELLVWIAGSYAYLSVLMMQNRTDINRTEREIMLHRVSEAVGAVQTVPDPDRETLIAWLDVRPPDLQYTYLFIDCFSMPTASAYQNIAATFMEVAHTLEQSRVFLKVFLPPSSPPRTFDIDSIRLRWSSGSLRQLLDAHIKQAAPADFTFEDFIDPTLPEGTPEHLVQKLIDHADGSLYKLFTLCNNTIRYHLNRPDVIRAGPSSRKWKYLDEYDFESVEE